METAVYCGYYGCVEVAAKCSYALSERGEYYLELLQAHEQMIETEQMSQMTEMRDMNIDGFEFRLKCFTTIHSIYASIPLVKHAI